MHVLILHHTLCLCLSPALLNKSKLTRNPPLNLLRLHTLIFLFNPHANIETRLIMILPLRNQELDSIIPKSFFYEISALSFPSPLPSRLSSN
jgi:hypothetical protein